MATITRTLLPEPSGLYQRVAWLALGNGDDGSSVRSLARADRSVQITGTFGAGGTVVIEGSNDGGTTWVTLTDPYAVALSFTAAGLRTIGDYTHLIRPRVTAGDGTTALNVHIASVAQIKD